MNKIYTTKEYKDWLKGLKHKFAQAQIKAAVKVNSTLLEFYWQLGGDIIEKQKTAVWGKGFLKQLSKDLMAEFPDIKGFSKRNLELIRQWHLYWLSDFINTKQLVSQLCQIPWGHNLKIISKCQSIEEAMYYVTNTQQNHWSRSVLIHQIENGLWQRDGKTLNNFKQTLPAPQSDLAQQTLKDPYIFDFLPLTKDHRHCERSEAIYKLQTPPDFKQQRSHSYLSANMLEEYRSNRNHYSNPLQNSFKKDIMLKFKKISTPFSSFENQMDNNLHHYHDKRLKMSVTTDVKKMLGWKLANNSLIITDEQLVTNCDQFGQDPNCGEFAIIGKLLKSLNIYIVSVKAIVLGSFKIEQKSNQQHRIGLWTLETVKVLWDERKMSRKFANKGGKRRD